MITKSTIQESLQMPHGWMYTNIGELSEVVRGASPRPKGDPRYFGGKIPWIMISDITREPGRYISKTRDTVTEAGAEKSRYLKKGTLILSNSGTVCVPKILAADGCIHDGFVAFPNLTHVNIFYLYYWFENIRAKIIQENKQGVTQVNLNTNIVRNMKVKLAPLNEQKRIVSKLEELFTKLDAGIEYLRKNLILLKRYRQSVFNAAFEGKFTKYLRTKKIETFKSPQIFINSSLKPKSSYSELKLDYTSINKFIENIPTEWDKIVLHDLSLEINSGFPSGKHNKHGHGVPHIRPMNINSKGELDLSNLKYVQCKVYDSLKKGDVLFNNTNSPALLGKTTCIKNDSNWAYSNHMTRIRLSDTATVNSDYVSYYLHNLFQLGFFRISCSHHVNQASINSNFLANIMVPIPSLMEQNVIVSEIERHFSIVNNLEKTFHSSLLILDTFKRSILKYTFEGKLVPQDPSDEPAEILLERIKSERKSLEALKEKSIMTRTKVEDNYKQIRLI